MKYMFIIPIVLVLLTGCGSGDQQKQQVPDTTPADVPEQKTDPVQAEDSSGKKPEEALLQVLSVLGYTKCGVRQAGDGVVVSYMQPEVTSDIDVYVAWNAIAFAAADMFPSKKTAVIETFFGKQLIMIAEFPVSQIQAFRKGEITRDEYRGSVELMFVPEQKNSSPEAEAFLKAD